LKSPFPLLIDALAKPEQSEPFIMPERIAKTDPMQQIRDATGSGPFRFLANEFVAGARAAYAKFDGYVPRPEPPDWASGGKVAHFKRVEWHIIPDAATASAALQSGEVDWWERVDADLVPLLRRNNSLTMGLANPTGYLGVRSWSQSIRTITCARSPAMTPRPTRCARHYSLAARRLARR
jgi:peptide/nickel transport system substrate-binding protein